MASQAAENIHLLHQKRLACDAITDLFEELEYRGEITTATKEESYAELATSCGFLDLLHRNLGKKRYNFEEVEELTKRPIPKSTPIEGAIMGTKSVILERSANAKIPEPVVEALGGKDETVLGYATVMMHEGVPQLIIGKNLDPAELQQYLDVTEDVNVLFHVDGSHKTKEVDHQPFTLMTNKADKPSLICFVEGDVDDFHETDGHTDAAHFVRDYLMPQIDTLAELADGDVDKVTDALQKESMKTNILAKCGERVVIQFMSVSGVAFTIENNDKRKDFDWGSASIVEGEYEYPAGKPDAAPLPDNPLAARIAAAKAKKEGGKPAGVHTTDATPKSVNQPPVSQETLKEASNLEVRLVYPPKTVCGSKNALNTWYNNGWGTCPQGKDIALTNVMAAVGMPRSELKVKYHDDPRYQCYSPGGEISTTDGIKKDVDTKNIPSGTTLPVAQGTTAGGFPVIPAGQKSVVTPWLKTIDMKSQDIFDPTKIQEIEKRASTFFEQYPDTPPNKFILGCPPEKLEEMFNKWPESYKLLMASLRFYAALYFLSQKKLVTGEETTHELAKDVLKPNGTGNPLMDRIAAKKGQAA